uniref:Uncharacterized protein n=1 Tax=Tanacetum cinerariifolium TaxID=118510 RepID=A0A699GHC8_TANCI|nr:hypothetical protein [Tanacetum cinerariifolium]
MTKSNNKSINEFKRTARISVRGCCFVNPGPVSSPYQNLSLPTDYQTVPPSTMIVSPPLSPIISLGISLSKLLNTPKTTHLPLTSSPPAPSQPSKQYSPLAINLDPIKLILSTHPTSPHTFFDSLEDLPPRTTNPQRPRPLFDSIERLANQPPPPPAMEPPLCLCHHTFRHWDPIIPFPCSLMKCFVIILNVRNHCQRTQVIVNDLLKEMRFILNHILERLDVLAYKNNSWVPFGSFF